MIKINKVIPIKKIEIKKEKQSKLGFADKLIEEVVKARYTELEAIKSLINGAKKNSKHKCNVLLLEKFIVDIEKEQGVTH